MRIVISNSQTQFKTYKCATEMSLKTLVIVDTHNLNFRIENGFFKVKNTQHRHLWKKEELQAFSCWEIGKV